MSNCRQPVEWLLRPPVPCPAAHLKYLPRVLTFEAYLQWIEVYQLIVSTRPKDWREAPQHPALSEPRFTAAWLADCLAQKHGVSRWKVPPYIEGESHEEHWLRVLDSFRRWLERQFKKRRGRKREYDPKKDARLVRDWEAARNQGQTKAGFCRERGIDEYELERALDRHRKRKAREP